jgi:hypothetical protein
MRHAYIFVCNAVHRRLDLWITDQRAIDVEFGRRRSPFFGLGGQLAYVTLDPGQRFRHFLGHSKTHFGGRRSAILRLKHNPLFFSTQSRVEHEQ